MKKVKWQLFLAAALAMSAAACSDDDTPLDGTGTETNGESTGESGSSTGGTTTTVTATADVFTNLSVAFDTSDATTYGGTTETVETGNEDFIENSTFGSTVSIAYSGTAATVTNNAGVDVAQDGAHVVVTSTVAGVEYVLSGSTTNGSFKIYSTYPYKLTLNGASITSTVGAAINSQSKQRGFVVLNAGTTNTLVDAASYTATVSGEDQKGTLFSEGALIFSGTGSVSVTGNSKHAIVSDSYVRFRSGTNVTVAAAVKDGIHTNGDVIVGGGSVIINSTGDAIDLEGAYTQTGGYVKVTTTDDKGHGVKATGNITVSGGAIQAQTSGAGAKAISGDADVTLTGGKLTLITSGNAYYDSSDADLSSAAGIKADGALTVNGASVYVLSTGKGGKGFSSDGITTIQSGTVHIITTGTQHVYGSLDTSPKGIKADSDLTISGGEIIVKTTGGEGSEGIESKANMTISGGNVYVYAYDDALNASTNITISGGNVCAYSTGNDGIDSNGTLTITGGVTVATGTTAPEAGLDCDNNTFKITGGVLLGVGGSTSTPTANASTQRSVVYNGTGTSGQYINISASGTNVMTYKLPRTYSQLVVLFSSADLTSGTSYTISKGGSISGGTEFFGLYSNTTYSGGTQAATFTPSSMVTMVGTSSGGFGGGGGFGR